MMRVDPTDARTDDSHAVPPVEPSMTTFVLIPGAGGEAWYWHLVVPRLEAAGHRAVAVELPASDPEAGLDAYVAAALAAVGTPEGDAVVVGQSLGGFTAPVVAERLGAAGLIFVAAMIPKPGETAGDWWTTSGFRDVWGDQEMDDMEHFFHDLPPAVLGEVLERGEPEQTGRVMEDPFPLTAPAAHPDARHRRHERPLLPGRLHGRPDP